MKTEELNCTCPSGDGSLKHPCPMHPANELKVGDVVSFKYNITNWTTIKLLSLFDISTFQKNIIIKRAEWQRGIHPSLIPEGFVLVEKAGLDNQSKQARIDELENAIREFRDADKAYCAARTDVGFKILDRYEAAKSKFNYLCYEMEQSK